MANLPRSEAFWRYAANKATQDTPSRAWQLAKAQFLGVEVGPQGKGATFRTNSKFRRQHRGGWISVGPELSRKTADLMEAVAPALTEAFDDVMGPWARDVLEAWPVSSGTSAATVDLNYIVGKYGSGTFTVQLVVRAPYAQQIKHGPAHKYVWQHVKERSRQIAKRAARDMAKG